MSDTDLRALAIVAVVLITFLLGVWAGRGKP